MRFRPAALTLAGGVDDASRKKEHFKAPVRMVELFENVEDCRAVASRRKTAEFEASLKPMDADHPQIGHAVI
jgi:hypothetical protein